jgi:hypothetical protein
MDTQIDTVIKRARGYWFVDGFTEITAGGLFILLAVVFLIRWNTTQSFFSSQFLSTAGEIAALKLVGFLVAVLILWWLKDRFTYPRTGYVRGNRITVTQVLVLFRNVILFLLLPILALIAVALLIASAGRVLSSMPVWFPMGIGLIWAILLVVGGKWTGLRRFEIIGALVLLSGIAIGVWQFVIGLPAFPEDIQPGIFQPAVMDAANRSLNSLGFLILVTGGIFLVSGLITFLRYRKENPVPYTEDV